MEKKFFPIFIDLTEKKIVVIGGGVIATRRIRTLLEFCSHITVVAPSITEELKKLIADGTVNWINETYHSSYIKDADMVVAATNQPDINIAIKKDCLFAEKETGRRYLFNSISEKEQCDFYFPSIVQSKDVVVGINSGGSSPKTTKQIREQIEKTLNSESIYS